MIPIKNGRRVDPSLLKILTSGAGGPVSDRFRFYYAPLFFTAIPASTPDTIIDISEYVTDYQFAWDADTAKRSGSITVDTSLMPNAARELILTNPEDASYTDYYSLTRDIGQGCVYVCHEILIESDWYRWPVGWFYSRQAAYERDGIQQITQDLTNSGFDDSKYAIGNTPTKLDLQDLTAYFDVVQCPQSYEIPSGMNYTDALHQVVTDSGFWDYTQFNITGDPSFQVGRWAIGLGAHLTNRVITPSAGTTWRSVLDKLTEGANYFPLFVAPNGELTTGKRTRPGLQVPKDWYGSTLTVDKMARAATALSTQAIREAGYAWDGGMSSKVGFTFPQAGLWNQVVTKGSFASETAMHNVSQIFDPSSLLDQTRIGQWVTIEKNIENPSGSGVLQEIADWYVYYADFHSVQLTIETPATFFVDKRINPYHKASIGTDWRTGYPSYWDYVELGWSFSKDQPMIRRYGTSPKLYNVIINQPADPS